MDDILSRRDPFGTSGASECVYFFDDDFSWGVWRVIIPDDAGTPYASHRDLPTPGAAGTDEPWTSDGVIYNSSFALSRQRLAAGLDQRRRIGFGSKLRYLCSIFQI